MDRPLHRQFIQGRDGEISGWEASFGDECPFGAFCTECYPKWPDRQAPLVAVAVAVLLGVAACLFAGLLLASSGCGSGPRRCNQLEAWNGGKSDRSNPCTEDGR